MTTSQADTVRTVTTRLTVTHLHEDAFEIDDADHCTVHNSLRQPPEVHIDLETRQQAATG